MPNLDDSERVLARGGGSGRFAVDTGIPEEGNVCKFGGAGEPDMTAGSTSDSEEDESDGERTRSECRREPARKACVGVDWASRKETGGREAECGRFRNHTIRVELTSLQILPPTSES